WVRRAAAADYCRAAGCFAEAGGSDAHFLAQIGSARTRFPGRTADDMRRALIERTAQVVEGIAHGRVGLGELATQQWRSMLAHPSRKLRRALFPGPALP